MSQRKIVFALEKDADGYPPADVEILWATESLDGGYIIDNIPFFARQVTLGDLVDATQVNGELVYTSTRIPSENSLIRVALFKGYDPGLLRAELARLGCSTEQSHLRSLVAVNVPPFVSLEEVQRMLDEGSKSGLWGYEEPILRQ